MSSTWRRHVAVSSVSDGLTRVYLDWGSRLGVILRAGDGVREGDIGLPGRTRTGQSCGDLMNGSF